MADYLLVNRNNTTYQVELEDKAMIEDNDLLLVNRDGTTYTVAGSEIRRSDFSEVIISPTGITPEVSQQTITATSDIPKVGSSVPADVFWNWYFYDSATGDAGKTLVQSTTNREITDTFILPASAAGKFIGCSVTYLAVTIDETQRCSVGIPIGPVADMHGLRFDRNRFNYLSRSFTTTPSKLTASVWIKPTDFINYHTILSLKGPTDSPIIAVNSSGSVYSIISSALVASSQGNDALTLNKWHHIVLQLDDSAPGKMYLNGVLLDGAGANANFGGFTGYEIGYQPTGPQYFDGYLSDFYLVEDAILEPTAFGAEFPEGWGPLDSSVVKENIANSLVQPYDTRPNYEEEWSAGIVTTTGNVNANQLWDNLFDGNLNDNTSASADQQDARATLTLPNLTWLDSVELYVKSNPPGNQQIRINDANIGATTVHDDYQDITSYLVGAGITQIQSIAIGDNVGGTATQLNYAAMRIDGRMLRDGPADNSQLWSYYVDIDGTLFSGSVVSDGFDGDVLNPLQLNNDSNDSTITFTPPSGIAYTSQVRVYILPSGTPSVGKYTVNGGAEQDITGTGWVTILTGNGTFTELTIRKGTQSNSIGFSAIEVDGGILLDAPAQWNTSQVWSSNYTNVTSDIAPLAFDGDLATQCYSDGAADAYFSISDVTATKVECYGFTSDGTFYVDGSSRHEVSCAAGWVEVYSGSAITVNKLGFTRDGASGGGHSAWRIDGKVLVDPGNFGSNGFYLSFDPNEDGYVYSASGTGTFNTNRGWDKAFNGLTSPGDESMNPVNDSIAELIFPTAIPFESLALWAGYGGSAPNNSFEINGVDVTGQIASAQARYPITISGATQLEKIKVTKGPSGFDPLILAVEIDGNLLVDHKSIGVDASGNDNHFLDQNVADGNTSKNWLSYFSCDKPMNTSNSLLYAFDGNLTDRHANEQVGSAIYTFLVPVSGNYKIYMYTNGQRPIKVDGTTILTVPTEGSPKWYDIGAVTAGQSITVDGNGQAGGSFIYGWMLDDELLIQPNIQDTVIDTPLSDYALIGSNSGVVNGNLSEYEIGGAGFTPITTQLFEAGGKHYIEVMQETGVFNVHLTFAENIWLAKEGTENGNWANGVDFQTAGNGDIIGAAIDVDAGTVDVYVNGLLKGTAKYNTSLEGLGIAGMGGGTGVTINTNYGQQPFIYATDNGNGTVTLIDTSPNMDEEWSDYVVTKNASYKTAFDGDPTTFGIPTAGSSLNWQYTINSADSLRLWININLNGPYTGIQITDANGVQSIALGSLPVNTPLWIDVTNDVTFPITQIEWFKRDSNSQGVLIGQIELDGKVLADGPADTSQRWSAALTLAPGASMSTGGPEVLFDGDLTTAANASTGEYTATFDFSDNPPQGAIRFYVTAGATFGGTPPLKVNGVDSGIGWSGSPGWVSPGGSPTELRSFSFGNIGPGNRYLAIAAVEVGGKLLVNGADTSSYNKLYQTWSQWVIQTLLYENAEASALRTLLKSHAQTYSAGTDYCEGTVIEAFGELWIAINDAPSTTFANIGALIAHVNWERLNIT